jgi:DNA-binding IclR family transcriptional regulator
LLAALPDEELDTYLAQSGPWPSRAGDLSADDLRRLAGQTRERGWALSRDDVTAGVSSLGVAVRLAGTGTPVCAVSIAGLSDAFTGDRLRTMTEVVRDGAARLAQILSGRGASTP